MTIINIFSGTFCFADDVIQQLAEKIDYEIINDDFVVKKTSQIFDVPENKLHRTLQGKVSAFNNFTHEKERNINYLRFTVSELVEKDKFILSGYCSLLVPPKISHVLRVCIIGDFDFRLQNAIKNPEDNEKEAMKLIHKEDEKATLWADNVLKQNPWNSKIYDILIPINKTTTEDAVNLIIENLNTDILKPTEKSQQAVKDFQLASIVDLELGKSGHDVLVNSENGKVTLTINKHSLMLSRLEDELKNIVSKIEGVSEVETKVGSGFYQVDIYRQFDPELPSKVLLVDDEREFVQTLSDRLHMRDIGSAVVYDGEEALSFVEEEEPEVMILDLKMPGVDGIEVLRQVKTKNPDIEIIVLTGHGSEKDKENCLELGAFAYLQKPVDIEKLSEIMKEAIKK